MRSANGTLCSYLKRIAAETPDRKLFGSNGGWYTAAEVCHCAGSIAAQLCDAGIRKGDILAIRMERSAQTLTALFGIRMLGAVAVLTDPHVSAQECLDGCVEPIQAAGIIYQKTEECFVLHVDGEDRELLLHSQPEYEMDEADADDNRQPGYIIFTSGSTGKTKAVQLSDRNLICNLIDSEDHGDYQPDDIALGILPLEHIFGLVLATGTLVLDYSLYLMNYTDAPSVLRVIAQEKITRMNGVPSLYLAMAEKSSLYNISSLRAGFIGGAPITEKQFTYIEESLGMTLVPVYGMSECIGISCGDHRSSRQTRCGNVGKVYSLNTLRILDENGEEVKRGEAGEIYVNGPARMLGYWPVRMPESEFMCTGDLGFIDESGYLHITGRKKEIIIRNGRNLSPVHIENVLLSLPSVKEAVVIGLPDEKAGEVPYAMVVGIVDPAELKGILPRNEMPAGFMCVDAMPRTASGKADKVRIREVLSKWRNG